MVPCSSSSAKQCTIILFSAQRCSLHEGLNLPFTHLRSIRFFSSVAFPVLLISYLVSAARCAASWQAERSLAHLSQSLLCLLTGRVLVSLMKIVMRRQKVEGSSHLIHFCTGIVSLTDFASRLILYQLFKKHQFTAMPGRSYKTRYKELASI